MTAPVNLRLVRRICEIVAADPSGGMSQQDLAARLHVRPADPAYEQALAVAAHQKRIAFCNGFIAAPGEQPKRALDRGDTQ